MQAAGLNFRTPIGKKHKKGPFGRQHVFRPCLGLRAAVPNLFGTRDQFQGRPFSPPTRGGRGGFGMIPAHCIYCTLCVHVLVAQSRATPCDPMDYSSPGPSVHGIPQARILVWVTFPFSKGSPQPRDQTRVSGIAGRFLSEAPVYS